MQEGKLQTRHAIPTGLQILLSDLNFISQIKRDTKPCCGDHVLVDSASWYGAFYRFYKGENRENSISKIEQIVTQTIDAIESHKDTEHIRIIINYFSEAREGIQALLSVYSQDPKIKAKIKVILDRIDIQLDRFRHLIKGFSSGDFSSGGFQPEISLEPRNVSSNSSPSSSNSASNSNSSSVNVNKTGLGDDFVPIDLLDSGVLDSKKKPKRKGFKEHVDKLE